MKPLNRPMFRYGGPIKEGIMQGMKEPQAINTVGSPLAPTDSSGRQGYAFPIIPALYAAGMAGIRALPTVYRGIRTAGAARAPGASGFFRNLFPTARFRTVRGKQQSPSPEFMKGDPTAFPGGPGPDRVLGFKEALTNPLLLGKAIRENPFTAFTAASALPQTAFLAGKGVVGAAKSLPDIAKGYIEAVLPGKQFDDKPEAPTKESGGLKRGDPKDKNVGTVTGTTAPGQAGGTTVKSDAEKQQINEQRMKETKERYYKLMGIDKMNKEAVYDSLIDASKIVQEQGGDLKGAIRSGNLQSSIIQAISQNLDKSADLKRQIDAAVLKGEIEKDIKANDPAAAVDLAYKKAATAKIQKDLKGPSAADLLLSAKTGSKNLVTSGTLQNILSSLGTKVDFTFPDDKYQKWEKNNEGKDEIDYLQENYGGLNDGTYIVNEKAFTVKDGSVFEIDLDEIVSKN